MAVLEKTYEQPPAVLWNAISDIVEMRKATVTESDGAGMRIDTDMYGIQTSYTFSVTSPPAGTTTVMVATDGESEDDLRRVELMFVTIDSLLAPFIERQADNG